MLIIASSWNILSLGFYCWVTCHSPQSAFLCSPLNVCAWGSVFLYVIPGVISSTSLSLATFGQGLIISFPDYFHSLLISCFWPFLFHCSYLAKTKMYDHITPLLRIFGRVSFVLRIESRLLALASRSLCCVTVCLFRFTALFFSPSCPFSELLMYWVTFGSANVSDFSCSVSEQASYTRYLKCPSPCCCSSTAISNSFKN